MILTRSGHSDPSEAKTLMEALIPLLQLAGHEQKVNPYQSITLCLIDAIFSINVRYEGVKNVVRNYCETYRLQERRVSAARLPPLADQDSIAKLVLRIQKRGSEAFASEVLQNRCRTSPTNGILKAEAVFRLAKILKRHGVNYLQDVPVILKNELIEAEFRTVPGQRSGISFKYFLMETGREELVKPDRMLLDWLERTLNRRVSAPQAQSLLKDAAANLRSKFPKVTPRQLDLLIWNHERKHPSRNSPPEPAKSRR